MQNTIKVKNLYTLHNFRTLMRKGIIHSCVEENEMSFGIILLTFYPICFKTFYNKRKHGFIIGSMIPLPRFYYHYVSYNNFKLINHNISGVLVIYMDNQSCISLVFYVNKKFHKNDYIYYISFRYFSTSKSMQIF